MQDLASEFQKIFRGDTPELSQREGRPPPAPNTQPAGRGAQAPHQCWEFGPKPWSPSTFQPWLRPCFSETFMQSVYLSFKLFIF